MAKEYHVLSFQDACAYECPLSWAQEWQRLIFGDSLFSDPRLNVPLKVEFAKPVPVEAVISALKAVVVRHDSLRALYVDAGDGTRKQRITGSGRSEVDVIAVDAADDVSELMEPLIHSVEVPLGPDELPFKAVVITQAGLAVAVVGWLQHMTTDGLGAMILAEEIQALATDGEAPLPEVWTMRDLIAYERGEQGRRQAAAALEYRRRQVRLAPARPERRPDLLQTPRFFEMAFNSTAVSTGVRLLARRHRVSVETVFLAAVALARGCVEGQARSLFSITCANRFKRGMSGMVANLYLDSLVSLELGRGRFSDLLSDAARAALSANKFGYFDPTSLASVIRPETSGDSGDSGDSGADFGWSLNFRITHGSRTIDPDPRSRDRTTVRDLADQSRAWMHAEHRSRPAQAMFAVWSLEDMASISFTADSARFRPEDVSDLLFAFEQAIIEAVEDDVPCGELLERLELGRLSRSR